MKRVGCPAGASASRLILKTKVAPLASAACLLAVVASAQILLLDDMELMAPRFALSITTGPADLSENIANFTALLISEAEHDRKIRAKGLNLKREETLADNAKSFDLGQRIDDFLSYSVGEIFIVCFAAHVLERQNGNGR